MSIDDQTNHAVRMRDDGERDEERERTEREPAWWRVAREWRFEAREGEEA